MYTHLGRLDLVDALLLCLAGKDVLPTSKKMGIKNAIINQTVIRETFHQDSLNLAATRTVNIQQHTDLTLNGFG